MRVALRVNGEPFEGEVPARLSLADLLRDRVGLTGTHLGCEHGICGACTVHVDGEPVRSCLMFAAQADGAAVRTVEGIAGADRLHPLQEAFREHHALQCGFCTAGFLMSIEPLLPDVPGVDDEALRGLLSGNLCRCTGYQGIVEATRATASEHVRTHQSAAAVPATAQSFATLAEPTALAAALRMRADGWEIWIRTLDRDERTPTTHLLADARRTDGPQRVRAGIELSLEDERVHVRVSARSFAVDLAQDDADRRLEGVLTELLAGIEPGVDPAPSAAPRGRVEPRVGAAPATAGAPSRARRLVTLTALAALGVAAAAAVRHRGSG